MKIINNNYY